MRLLYRECRVMSRWRDPCVQSNAQCRAATGPCDCVSVSAFVPSGCFGCIVRLWRRRTYDNVCRGRCLFRLCRKAGEAQIEVVWDGSGLRGRRRSGGRGRGCRCGGREEMRRPNGGHLGNRAMEPCVVWRILMASRFSDPQDCSEKALASESDGRNGHVAWPFQTGPLPCPVSVVDRR